VTDIAIPRQGKSILIAEDNAALALVVRFHLEHAGYVVTVAVNGREAWELAQSRDFDLAIFDEQMPEMNGSEVCQKLRDDPQRASLPVLMLTAKGLEMEHQWAREHLGVLEVLSKPFSVRELIDTVEKYLECSSSQVPSRSAAESQPTT
jgi:CheY-like chemotaxis protein